MEQIALIPAEMLKLIPMFDGDRRHLNLYIRKAEYIIDRFRGNQAQDEYLLCAITSRLMGDAAALVSEREDINTWQDIRAILLQHFGDPRSEECIAIELESLKIRQGESFGDFCKRIQSVRSNLFSKVNLIQDDNLKQSKLTIYNHTSLNVFLYNLPEKMVRIVRLHQPDTLEDALKVVLEEVNFLEQYNLKNRNFSSYKQPASSQPQPPQSQQPPRFKFGIPPQFNQMPRNAQPPFRLPQIANHNPQNNNFGFKPQTTPIYNQQNQRQGFRPFGFAPQGYRPAGLQQQPPMKPQEFGVQRRPPVAYHNDVSMRTAPPRNTHPFRVNELELNDYDPYYSYPIDDSCSFSEYYYPASYPSYPKENPLAIEPSYDYEDHTERPGPQRSSFIPEKNPSDPHDETKSQNFSTTSKTNPVR